MRLKISSFAIVCLLLFSAFRFFNPLNDLAQRIFDNLKNYNEEFPQEKVFLHFDKPYYSAGEEIWFSAYLTAGNYQIPSVLSKVLYVDFLRQDGTLIDQKRVRISEGRGRGDFQIPYILEEGSYRIRAYSNWMKNFDEEYFFHKDITIFDPYLNQFQPFFTWEIEETTAGQFSYTGNFTILNKTFGPYQNAEIDLRIRDGINLLRTIKAKSDEEGQGELQFTLDKNRLKSNLQVDVQLISVNMESVTRKISIPYPLQLIDLQFFPEGGDLISGIESKVAFKATYPDGSPARIDGYLHASSNDTLALVQSNSMGIGAFDFSPEVGKNYVVSIDSEAKINFALPNAKENGISLRIDNLKPNQVFVQVKGKMEGSDEFVLVAHTRGLINHMAQGQLGANGIILQIPKSKLMSGVNHITIFNAQGIPMAERLIFTDQEDDILIDTSLGEFDFTERGKASLEIKTSDKGGNPINGTFSVSVTDAFDTQTIFDDEDHIKSNLLLSSDLRGKIQNPAYYFQNESIALKQELDFLLLTQGWRRFSWEEVLSGRLKETPYYIEQGINITGTITNLFDRSNRLRGGELITFLTTKEEEFITSTFDETGKFIIPGLDFYDTATVVLQAKDNRFLRNIKVNINQPNNMFEKTELIRPSDYGFKINQNITSFLERSSERVMAERLSRLNKVIELDELVIRGRKPISDDDIIKTYGMGDFSIDPGSDRYPITSNQDIFSFLQGKIPGLNIQVIPGISAEVSFRRNRGGFGGGGGEMLFLVNDVPVPIDFLFNVSINQIASIEVFRDPASTAVFGSQGGPGVIAIYTKRGLPALPDAPGVVNFLFPGYHIPKEFYSPVYETEEDKTKGVDVRSTLYWNPEFKTDETGVVKFNIYNNDRSESFRVTVQGIDQWGRLGYSSKVVTKKE
jgi:hypothetical protein